MGTPTRMRGINKLRAAAAAACLCATVSSAHAGVIFRSEPDAFGLCKFESGCGSLFGQPNTHAAEKFTLSEAVIISSVAFIAVIDGGPSTVSSIDWSIRLSDGPFSIFTNLPGTRIAGAGGQPFTITEEGVNSQGKQLEKFTVDVGSLALAAGSYWLTFHATGHGPDTYLSASITGPAAESFNGGRNWILNYEGVPGVAVEINSPTSTEDPDLPVATPEPETLAMFTVGLLALGLRRIRRPA